MFPRTAQSESFESPDDVRKSLIPTSLLCPCADHVTGDCHAAFSLTVSTDTKKIIKNEATDDGLSIPGMRLPAFTSLWTRLRSRWSILSQDAWWPEVWSLVLGATCLVVLTILVRVFDQKPLHDWYLGITLNAVISIIITVMAAALSLPLASRFGQLKWTELKRSKQPLLMVQQLDSASRSTTGCFGLLLSARGCFIGTFGAIVALLILAVGPFAQQVVGISYREQHVAQALIRIAVNGTEVNMVGSRGQSVEHVVINPSALRNGKEENLMYLAGETATLPMVAAIYNILLGYSTKGTLSTSPYTCPTGNCTWDPFLTLGVCSGCSNITNLLQPTLIVVNTTDMNSSIDEAIQVGADVGADVIRWTLPSEYYNLSILSMTGDNATNFPTMDVTAASDLNFSGAEKPFLHFALVNSSVYNATEATALECSMRICLQKIEADVQNGRFSENRTEATVTWETNDNYNYVSPPSDNETSFMVSFEMLGGLRIMLDQLFFTMAQGQDGGPYFDSYVAEALWYSDNVSAQMDYLAESMSIHLREAGSGGSDAFPGQAFTTEYFFAVRWAWLVFPFAVALSAAVFAGLVMIETERSRTPLWKNSLLAILSLGFDYIDRGQLKLSDLTREDFEKASNMDNIAEAVHVQLCLDKKLGKTRLAVTETNE